MQEAVGSLTPLYAVDTSAIPKCVYYFAVGRAVRRMPVALGKYSGWQRPPLSLYSLPSRFMLAIIPLSVKVTSVMLPWVGFVFSALL